jgi:maleate isomerase
VLACGNWSTFSIIDELERNLGTPVLTTNQVTLWHALKMMGWRPLGGLGVLLREHLSEKTARYPVSADTQ